VKEMDVLFLGGVFPNEMGNEILSKSKGTVHYAANKLQWNLIDGFININDVILNILSAPLIGTYPNAYNDMFIKKFNYLYHNKVKLKSVSFCNIWGYRNISRKNALIKQVKEYANKKALKKVIIVYSPHTPYLQAAVYAKQIDPTIHICLVVPDLPQFMNLSERTSIIYNILKKVDIKVFNKNAKIIDSFVLLSKYMKDPMNVGDRPYIIVEGVVNSSETLNDNLVLNKNDNDSAIKSIVYTGTLNKKFGVVNLIKAFHAISRPDIELNLCGTGDSEDVINEYCKKDGRIKFVGQLSNERALKLQTDATILVNPRPNNEEFTKYSFPSKNMEYLLSGNPVIAYKLDGIPDEYDDYIYYVEDNSIETLSNKINEVLDLTSSERNEFGSKARQFVLKYKNNNEASRNIYNMIKTY
jgi:glycosyltransferase involved in cell wall biosynthesis